MGPLPTTVIGASLASRSLTRRRPGDAEGRDILGDAGGEVPWTPWHTPVTDAGPHHYDAINNGRSGGDRKTKAHTRELDPRRRIIGPEGAVVVYGVFREIENAWDIP